MELDDISQGQVGDCYLLAALANLTGEESHLIEEMIAEKEGKYIVTLYKSGIPVQIEIDKKLMVHKIKHKNNIGNTVIDEKYIANAPQDDIWASIIEKAYAKFMAKGEFTDDGIHGGRAREAMKVLLGNKVKVPKKIYLDDTGNISDEPTDIEFKNPILLGKVSEETLHDIILSAKTKGYKINVSSPPTYKGDKELTDRHVVKIDSKNYMNFNHTYTLTEANEKNITLFNPHAKDKQPRERQIFNQELKKDIDKLNAIIAKEGKISTEEKEEIHRIINLDRNKGIKKETSRNIGNLRSKINAISDLDIAKGFISTKIEIEKIQTITYPVLKKYFESLTITIIKKD